MALVLPITVVHPCSVVAWHADACPFCQFAEESLQAKEAFDRLALQTTVPALRFLQEQALGGLIEGGIWYLQSGPSSIFGCVLGTLAFFYAQKGIEHWPAPADRKRWRALEDFIWNIHHNDTPDANPYLRTLLAWIGQALESKTHGSNSLLPASQNH